MKKNKIDNNTMEAADAKIVASAALLFMRNRGHDDLIAGGHVNGKQRCNIISGIEIRDIISIIKTVFCTQSTVFLPGGNGGK